MSKIQVARALRLMTLLRAKTVRRPKDLAAELEVSQRTVFRDLNVLATLFVNSMIVVAEALEDAQGADAIEDIRRTAVKQLRLIVIGVDGWRSSP